MKTALRIASEADGGYVAGQRFYAYYPDFQGNVHVVASDGEFLQSNHYYPYGLPFAEGVAPKFQPHKYSGKEFLSDRSLNLYDFHARLQDPIIGGFDRMDNKLEKYYSISPYVYCLGNPIRNIDLNGEEPTPLEAAAMAVIVYDDAIRKEEKDFFATCQKALSDGGWRRTFNTSIMLRHPAHTAIGMQSMLFERTLENGKKEYAYVYAGTNGWEDAGEDITQLFGYSPQCIKAKENSKQLLSEIGDSEITFVGHSLGALLARLSALNTGRKAICFNPALPSNLTLLFLGLINKSADIETYISSDCFGNIVDPITVLQSFDPGLILQHDYSKTTCIPVSYFCSHGIKSFFQYFKNQQKNQSKQNETQTTSNSNQ